MQIINANNAVLLTAALACMPALTAGAPITQDGALAGASETLFDTSEIEARAGSLADNVDFADEPLFEASELEARGVSLEQDKKDAKAFIKLNSRDIGDDAKAVINGATDPVKKLFAAILRLSAKEGQQLAKGLGVPIAAAAVNIAANAGANALSTREPEPLLPFLALGVPLFQGLLRFGLRTGLNVASQGVQAGISNKAQNKNTRALPTDDDFFGDEEELAPEGTLMERGLDLSSITKGASPAVVAIFKMLGNLTKAEAQRLAQKLNIPGLSELVGSVPIPTRDLEARDNDGDDIDVDSGYYADMQELAVRALDPKTILDNVGPTGTKIFNSLTNLSPEELAKLAKKLNLPQVEALALAAAGATGNALSQRNPGFGGLFKIVAPIFKKLLRNAIQTGTEQAVGAATQQRDVPVDESLESTDEVEMDELLTRSTANPFGQIAKGSSQATVDVLKQFAEYKKADALADAQKLGLAAVPTSKATRDVSASLEARGPAISAAIQSIIDKAPAAVQPILTAAAKLPFPEKKKIAEKFNLHFASKVQARDPKFKVRLPSTLTPKINTPSPKVAPKPVPKTETRPADTKPGSSDQNGPKPSFSEQLLHGLDTGLAIMDVVGQLSGGTNGLVITALGEMFAQMPAQ
jgi:hypothetical protein